MRQTTSYTGTHYSRDNGFPIVGWIVRIFTKRATSGIEDEAGESLRRNTAGQRAKIIGRVAGPEAWKGKSAERRQEGKSSRGKGGGGEM